MVSRGGCSVVISCLGFVSVRMSGLGWFVCKLDT